MILIVNNFLQKLLTSLVVLEMIIVFYTRIIADQLMIIRFCLASLFYASHK